MHEGQVLLHERPISIRYVGLHLGRGSFGSHQHETWEVIYQRTGSVRTRQGRESFEMHPGMVLVHPPRVPHEDIFIKPYTLHYAFVEAPTYPGWPQLTYDDPHQTVERLFDALWREWSSDAKDREEMIACLGNQLNLWLRRALNAQVLSPEARIVERAQSILERRIQDPPTMAQLAEEVGVSRSSFYSHFQALRGQSPLEYLNQVRLRNALGLLRNTTSTLEEIAEACGYHSASHLSRHVKAATGNTPGALRNWSK